jgi:hypothetical protein
MSKQNSILNEENLKKETPLLHSIPKRNPFTVPEGYFDGLPSSILEKCRETAKIPTFSKIFWLFRPQWMMAVSVCAVCLGFLFRNNTPASFETLASQVSDSAIYNHLQNNIDFVDVGSLEDAVQSEGTLTQPAQSDTATDQQDEINYLINHNIDATDIENEL